MSDTLRLVEIAYTDFGAIIAHTESYIEEAIADMETITAQAKEVAVVAMNKTPEQVAAVKADIKERIDNGSTTPVLASHLDQLGMRNAVLQWAPT